MGLGWLWNAYIASLVVVVLGSVIWSYLQEKKSKIM